jgi:hypothetical protein
VGVMIEKRFPMVNEKADSAERLRLRAEGGGIVSGVGSERGGGTGVGCHG